MRGSGAGTIKLAVTVASLSETLPLADIGREGQAVVIGMGDAGVPTRLLAARFGSRWTYGGNAVAPGQIPAARMVEEFGFRRVGGRTRLFGVVSTNALHSLSPAMHNAAFRAAGLDAVYVPLRAADFEDFQTFAAAMGIEGASITIPFKRDALMAASTADALTQQVGAANTLRRIGSPATSSSSRSRNGWDATNTDVAGFLAPLEAALGSPLDGLRASVLGAGGAARAVVVALRSRGAHVTVHARRREQAEEVTGHLGATPGPWPPAPGSWDLLVNCTPLGGGPLRDESPLPDGRVDGRCVYDLTYAAGESALLRAARAAGCATLDGLPMLVAQAEQQFAWWTGQRPAPGVMRDAAYGRLGLARSSSPLTTETSAFAKAAADQQDQG
jgi:3-dehydroquinate dehydratase/shikimate dehydrogenase